MSDLRTSIIVDLSGNLQSKAKQYTNSLNRFGRKGASSMRLLSRGVALAGRGIDRLGNRYTAFLTGAAGIGAIRQVGNLEERFVRIGIQANRSDEEINGLKKRIFEVAKAPDIRVYPGQITSAVEEIIEKTGDLKFAEENIRNIGLAISATGGDGISIGGILAEFQKMGIGAKEAFEALDILSVQGKEGAFTLQDLAAMGPRVVTAYTSMGRTGVKAIREMGAALQVIQQGTGNREQATTAFEAVLRTLGDADKVKLLRKGGIRIFEKGSTTQMRSLPEIMTEIIEKTKGSKLALSKVFDAEAIRAFNAAASEFQRTGKVESLKKFYDVHADGKTTVEDSIRASKTLNSSLRALYTVWEQLSDNQLTEPIKKVTEYLDGLKPGTVERWLEMGKNVTLVGGGLIAAYKLTGAGMNMARWGREIFGKKKGLTGAIGQAGKFGDAIPVYVVNGPASLWDKGASGAATGAAAGGGVGGMAVGALSLTPAAATGAIAAASNAIGKKIAESQAAMTDTNTLREMMRRMEVQGAGPGSAAYKTIWDELDRREVAELEKRFSGELAISIESDAPVRVNQLKSSRGFDIDMDAGRMMVAH